MSDAMTADGYQAIPSVLSKEGDNIVLLFGDSTDQTWNAHAFQVNQISRRIERVNNLPTLAPGESLDFGYLGESGHSSDVSSPGQDRLRVGDDRDETLTEYGIGVRPDGVLVGVQNPAGDVVTGVIDADRLRGFDPQASNANDFNDFGSVRSVTTTTGHGTPTTALSETNDQGLFRFDKADQDLNNIYLGFYNTREEEVSLEVLAQGATYKVTHVDDPSVVRDMFYGDGYKRRLATYGGLTNTKPKRPNDWVGGELELTSDDVRSQIATTGGGGR